jgi:hypothetical protein
MRKMDLKKQLKELCAAKVEPSLVEVPPLSFLAADGSGDPRGSARFNKLLKNTFSGVVLHASGRSNP